MDPLQMTASNWIFTLMSVCYVWALPLLAMLGFSEPGSTSISGFIANAHATGAMAVISFVPINLIIEYQEFKIRSHEKATRTTLWMFLLSYGAFLICSVNFAPTIHSIVVACFGVCFILHNVYIIRYIEPSAVATSILLVGSGAFVSLLFVKGMWFWAMECVGFTCMVLFTPLELVQWKQPPLIQGTLEKSQVTLV
jgi:hypothetical protein